MKWIVFKLKWFLCREELEALQRYRTACITVRRWNCMCKHSVRTSQWIEEVGEGHSGLDIEKLRREMR